MYVGNISFSCWFAFSSFQLLACFSKYSNPCVLIKFNLSFFFLFMFSGYISLGNICTFQNHRYAPMYSRKFIVLASLFRLVIHSKLPFVILYKIESKICSSSLQKSLYLPLNLLGIFVKIDYILHVCVCMSIPILYFITLSYLSFLQPMTPSPAQYRLILNLRSCSMSP